jgi:hypothetical protein
MAKPSTIAAWATDSGATSDPGPTRRATGFVPGMKLPAKWLNWLFNQNGAWFTYLRDLHTEPEFLNKVYAWTGAHRFASSLGAFQNVVFGPGSEPLYGNASGTLTPRSRTVLLPNSAFLLGSTHSIIEPSSWVYISRDPANPLTNTPGFFHTGGQGPLIAEFQVPHGARVTSVFAGAVVPDGATLTMSAGVKEAGADINYTFDDAHGVSESWTGGNTLTQSGQLRVNPANPVHDSSTSTRIIRFTAAEAGGSIVKWVKVVFEDPGPRNF